MVLNWNIGQEYVNTYGPAQVGQLIGVVLVYMVVAAIWLIVAKIVPPLRKRPRVSNALAAALVCVFALASVTGTNSQVSHSITVTAAVIVLALIWWNYRRDSHARIAKGGAIDGSAAYRPASQAFPRKVVYPSYPVRRAVIGNHAAFLPSPAISEAISGVGIGFSVRPGADA